VADLRVRLLQWSYGWQYRRLVTARMLDQMFVRLIGWMVLLARYSASKYAELLVLRKNAVLRRQTPKPKRDWADQGSAGCPGLGSIAAVADEPADDVGNAAALAPAADPLAMGLSHRGGRPPVDPRAAALIGQWAQESRAGATGGSRASCSAWASGSAPRRYGGC
jgi:hypothetical protein